MITKNPKRLPVLLAAATLAAVLAGCGGVQAAGNADGSAASAVVADTPATTTAADDSAESAAATIAGMATDGVLDTSELFTERDLAQEADLTGVTSITVASGEDVHITEEGVYVLSGNVTDVTIYVEADDAAKVQLVLDGLTIENADFPCIYVVSADKVFVTTASGSENSLSVTGTFVADGDTNTDAAIFSRDDLVLNGLGSLTINSTDNGVSCKDDLKVTGGTYDIACAGDALEANDSIRISDGTIGITTSEDGLHSENDEDDTAGFVYICGGTLSVDAGDDAIHATTYLQVDGGTLSINAAEALEATYVQVNGGSIDISASDDGINASYKSESLGTPVIEIRGGEIAIAMGQGDTDAIDSNGNLVVSGGTVSITAQFAFDVDGSIEYTGGTVYVNGGQVTSIQNSMMMGGPGGEMGAMGAPAEGQTPDGQMPSDGGMAPGGEMGGGQGGMAPGGGM